MTLFGVNNKNSNMLCNETKFLNQNSVIIYDIVTKLKTITLTHKRWKIVKNSFEYIIDIYHSRWSGKCDILIDNICAFTCKLKCGDSGITYVGQCNIDITFKIVINVKDASFTYDLTII